VATRLAFAVGRSVNSVAWGPRTDRVNLVLLIAIPPSCAGEYLNLMAGFANLIRDPVLRNRVLLASDAEEIFTVFQSINSRNSSFDRATAELDR
jgi:mannitol/fructose-specific phosphotransferase system IIA component (Ntr-type)